MNADVAILFVCLGNICRSPAAEGIMRAKVNTAIANAQLSYTVMLDSAGTGNWHTGNPPDKRMQQACLARGYDISQLQARTVNESDFYQFDYVFGMDESNVTNMQPLYLNTATASLGLLLRETKSADAAAHSFEVPDPYYSGASGFATVINLLEQATDVLVDRLQQGVPLIIVRSR